jgi:hypothetical protein
VVFGVSTALAIAAVIGMVAWILPALKSRVLDDRHSETALAAWLIAAWYFGLLVSTPAYHPYPRLTLPWLVAAWLGTGALFGAARDWMAGSRQAKHSAETGPGTISGKSGVGAVALIAACFWSGKDVTSRGIPAWEDRADLERVSVQVVERARQVVGHEHRHKAGTIVMYVYGEPAAFFHVGRSEGIVAAPVVELRFAAPGEKRPDVPTFLVAAPPAATSEIFAAEWKKFGSQFREVGVFHYHPSDLVLLDNLDAKALTQLAHRPEEAIRLNQLKKALVLTCAPTCSANGGAGPFISPVPATYQGSHILPEVCIWN